MKFCHCLTIHIALSQYIDLIIHITNYEDHYKFSNHSRITGLPFAVNVVMDTEYNMNILAEELQSRCEAFDIDEYVRDQLNAKAEGASGIPNTDILVEEGTDITI